MNALAKTITSLALVTLTSLVGSASAQDRHGITIQPLPNSELYTRPRGLFFSVDDDTADYNSYTYDDRFHGPSTSYSSPPVYYYAPGYSARRRFGGDVLYYWAR
jgi:hypothetical protein